MQPYWSIPTVASLILLSRFASAQEPPGYQAQVAVEGETRIDWIFALANQSREQAPAQWLAGYDSNEQRYKLFVPPKLKPRKPAPLVLLISPSGQPAGWEQWRQVCEASGVVFSGLMQLQGITVRWPDLPQAEKAREILLEYEGRDERPWEKDDVAEQRRFLIAEARSLDRYAAGPLPQQYEPQRAEMIRAAIELWKQALAEGPETPEGKEARQRIEILEKIKTTNRD